MNNFDYAFTKTLKHEGGYNEVNGDSGGATNFGISLKFLSDLFESDKLADIDGNGIIDKQDIKKLKESHAKEIYLEEFWLKNKCDKILDKDIAAKYFDMSVNMGLKQACRILQRSLNQFKLFNLVEDGKIGPATLQAVNQTHPEQLLKAIKGECEVFYLRLADARPEYKKFLQGWLNRARS